MKNIMPRVMNETGILNNCYCIISDLFVTLFLI